MHRTVCHILFILSFNFIFDCTGFAQCIAVDSASPYFQDFEASSGNWTTGGTLSDWQWGHPAKAIITGAAGGQSCWITGGLTGSSYNATQRSYIVSPCFDFTNLKYPYIEFKVFWETEYRYDGNSFQYSVDNGNTWLNVGSANEAQNCLNNNWFNYPSISNMTGLGPNKEGWSGTTLPSNGSCSGGNGSVTWVKASHTLINLAGKPNVIFRFTCGAGTTCNDYDGFAVDDIKISNAPPNFVDFAHNCISENKIAFNNLSSPCFSTYSWDFGDPASGATNISQVSNATHTFSGPGSYTVTLTGSGASGPAVTVAKQVHIMDVKASITKTITCGGSADGAATATLTANAGITGISYNWNTTPAATTPSINGLGPGIYIVTVTAVNACTTSDTVNIVSPQPLTHQVVKKDATCGNANGTISISENGGTGPYSFSWSPNVAGTSVASNLLPGIYIISITDAKGCSDSVHVQIVNLGGITVFINGKTDVKCFGGSTGAATVTVNGGTGNYSYAWSPIGGNAATASQLQAGIYKVVVTDMYGCKDSATVQINQPSSSLSATISTNQTTCGQSNGTANVHVTGGIPAYSYQWIPGNFATDSIYNLSPGTYNVTVTDAYGCAITKQADVNPSSLPKIVSLVPTPILCFGQQTGSIAATVQNGVPPYTFTWTSGSNIYTGNPLQNLYAGTYQLKVTDSKGCVSSSQSVTVNQPSKALQHSVTVNNISCTNTIASASIAETGGTPSYSYAWSPTGGNASSAAGLAVGNYIVRILDQNSCLDTVHISITNTSTVSVVIKNIVNVSCNGGSNGSATAVSTGVPPFSYAWSPLGGNLAVGMSLPAGNYMVTAKDATGCLGVASVQITQPLAINSSIITTPTTCNLNNGSASVLSVSGGTAPYTYSWMPGNMTSASVNNLAASSYTLSITDARGCSVNQPVVVSPSKSTVIDSVVITDARCYATQTGAANASVSGGLAPYSFNWARGSNTFTGNPLQNAGAGTYQLTVSDSKGCKATKSVVINQPLPLAHTINSIEATCHQSNGSASITESGGNRPYTFLWPAPLRADSNAFSLAEGNYLVRVTDSNQCVDSFYVSVLNRGGITAQLDSVANVSCFGGNNGFASVNVSPATSPVSYAWSNGAGNVLSTRNLKRGNYSVTVTDTVGCVASVSFVISQPPVFSIAISAVNSNCNHNNGQATATTSGGTPPYSYVWAPGNIPTAAIINLSAGQYSVTATDKMGCQTNASVKIEESCQDIVFPDAFTPDGNKINDAFGPLGTLSAVSDYTFRIFNRWGQPVFTSTDPFKKWNGKLNGTEAGAGVYVWIAEYSFDHRPRQAVKGTVILVK